MELFTIQMSKYRLARDRQIVFVDTTVKSGFKTGGEIFAPTWDMVMASKSGELSHEEYAERYRQLMIQSWHQHRDRWKLLLESAEPVAIACYCPAGKFCHRYLLKDHFQEICQKYNIPFLYYGELQ